MKGFIRIGGASFLGIGLILLAFYVSNNTSPQINSAVVVVPAPARTSIAIEDADGDGMADWESELNATVFETIQTPTSTTSTEAEQPYAPPTSFTGKFSIAFFKDYMEGKMRGQNFSDPTALVESAVATIEKNTQTKKHTRLELNLVESTPDSLREYGNALVRVLYSSPVDLNNDLNILQRALQARDSAILNELEPIKNAYEVILYDLLAMSVPAEFAEQHVEILNTGELLLANVSAMQQTFTDPLYTLALIRNHGVVAQNHINNIKSITQILTKNNIVYSKDELGAQLYLFDI